jgi:hypothetical protein
MKKVSIEAMTGLADENNRGYDGTSADALLSKVQSTQSAVASLFAYGIDSLFKASHSLPVGPCDALSRLFAARRGVSEAVLQQKIYLFFIESQAISDYILDERAAWADAQEQEILGRQIVLMLERADDERKASLYGQLYCSLVRQKLTKEEFGRLCNSVDRAFYEDLKHLLDFAEVNAASGDMQPIAESLQSAGLLSFEGTDTGSYGEDSQGGGSLYRLNRFGRLLSELTRVCEL